MKKILVLLILFGTSYSIKAQILKLGLQTGYAQYKMDDFEKYVNEKSDMLAFETKRVQNFPPNIYFKPTMQIEFNRFGMGVSYSFHSTGARITRNDYSGEYYNNVLTNGHTLGTNVFVWINSEHKLKLGLNGEFGLHYTAITLDESLILVNNSSFFEYDYNVIGSLYAEPGLKLAYSYSRFNFEISCAYLFPLNQIDDYAPLKKAHDKGYYKIEWDGMRAGLTILYSIKNWGKE